jgi:hypothetical protein
MEQDQNIPKTSCLVGEVIFKEASSSKSFSHYDIWVNGQSLGVTGDQNQTIKVQQMTEEQFRHTHTILHTLARQEEITPKQLKEYTSNWLKDHPRYQFNHDNCHAFTRDFTRDFFGFSLKTQTNDWGQALVVVASMLLITSVGLLVQGIRMSNR